VAGHAPRRVSACAERMGHGATGGGVRQLPRIFLSFDLKMEHFYAVFQLDLTEENCDKKQNT